MVVWLGVGHSYVIGQYNNLYLYFTACVFPENIQTPQRKIFSLDPLPLIPYFPFKILAFETLFPLWIYMNLPWVVYVYFLDKTVQIWNLIYFNHKPTRCVCSGALFLEDLDPWILRKRAQLISVLCQLRL